MNTVTTISDVVTALKWGDANPTESHKKIDAVITNTAIDFAVWLQDNYSTNQKQGLSYPLPKGKWREDFTDDVFDVQELWLIYKEK